MKSSTVNESLGMFLVVSSMFFSSTIVFDSISTTISIWNIVTFVILFFSKKGSYEKPEITSSKPISEVVLVFNLERETKVLN